MDIALFIIEQDRKTLHFAGANNSLYIIRPINNNNFAQETERLKIYIDKDYALIQLKPDKMPVGNYKSLKPFTSQTVNIMQGDNLYVFSDGILDQFGGEYGKRFGSQRFRKLLFSIQGFSMKEQKSIIEQTLEDWMRQNPGLKITQLDDVMVIGLKVD